MLDPLRCMGTRPSFPAMFSKRDSFDDFPFGLPGGQSLLKMGSVLKGKSLLQMGGKNENDKSCFPWP